MAFSKLPISRKSAASGKTDKLLKEDIFNWMNTVEKGRDQRGKNYWKLIKMTIIYSIEKHIPKS